MTTLVDTGALVALFSPRDEHHEWAVEHFARLPAPLLSCTAVFTEAFHLLKGVPDGWERLAGYLERDRSSS